MTFEINLDSSVIISVLIEDEYSEEVINAISKLKEAEAKVYLSLRAYSEIWTGIELIQDINGKNRSIYSFKQILNSIDAKIVSDNIVIAQRAAKAQAEYRNRGGKREFLIPDFLIGANAEFYSKRILTTNPRDFMKYFPDVKVLTPPMFLKAYLTNGLLT